MHKQWVALSHPSLLTMLFGFGLESPRTFLVCGRFVRYFLREGRGPFASPLELPRNYFVSLSVNHGTDSKFTMSNSDDAYTVWVNGVEIGDNIRKGGDPAGSAFRELDIYSVSLSHTKNVIAVNATNVVSVDGVILTGVVQYEDGSQTAFVTDASWLTAGNIPPPEKFQVIDYDDSRWAHAIVIGPVGTQPWGVLHFAPFTGKVCGQSDQLVSPDGPLVIPPLPLVCPILPPLPDGTRSPYWDLRSQVDCEIRRLEEALFLCQREKQKLINQILILIKQIGGTDICQLIQCSTSHVQLESEVPTI